MIFFRCLSSFRCHWVHMFWYYSCIIITPLTQWHKIAMDYAHGICGSGIWSWQRMACCVFSSVSGFQLEALKAGGRGILKARSFTCLVVNSGCWLRASVSLHVVSSFEPVWVSSLHGGWIPKAKKVGEGWKREQCEHQVGAITFSWSGLWSGVAPLPSSRAWSRHRLVPRLKGRENRPHL